MSNHMRKKIPRATEAARGQNSRDREEEAREIPPDLGQAGMGLKNVRKHVAGALVEIVVARARRVMLWPAAI